MSNRYNANPETIDKMIENLIETMIGNSESLKVLYEMKKEIEADKKESAEIKYPKRDI